MHHFCYQSFQVDDSVMEKCTDSDQISVVDDLESCKKQKRKWLNI